MGKAAVTYHICIEAASLSSLWLLKPFRVLLQQFLCQTGDAMEQPGLYFLLQSVKGS